jgi:hypothetical protein
MLVPDGDIQALALFVHEHLSDLVQRGHEGVGKLIIKGVKDMLLDAIHEVIEDVLNALKVLSSRIDLDGAGKHVTKAVHCATLCVREHGCKLVTDSL